MITLRFQTQMDPEQTGLLRRVLRQLTKTRACRTCDYGDSPTCGHEQRAQRTCAAPRGDFDCAVLPCLGGCITPAAEMGA